MDFWHGKKVFITGHTGFKGTWLSLLLESLGAKVTGFALAPECPSLHNLVLEDLSITSIINDIRNKEDIISAVTTCNPDILIHLAAQPLVRYSYMEPALTFSVNVQGTVNFLEGVRAASTAKVALVITTDKCYRDQQWVWGYREIDSLGGFDPYSASKAAAELVVESYRHSFFGELPNPVIASARAGNVIGGGDWAADRLIPDLVRAWSNGKTVHIRRPDSVRPWQHVLEALSAYLDLIRHCWIDRTYGEAWNFGPEPQANRSVEWMVKCFADKWGGGNWDANPGPHPHETGMLTLDCTKAALRLGWHPVLDLETTLEWTASWYKRHLAGEPATKICRDQIRNYLALRKGD